MSTGRGHFAPLNSDFEQNFGQIVPIKNKDTMQYKFGSITACNREKGSLLVDVASLKEVASEITCYVVCGKNIPFSSHMRAGYRVYIFMVL